MVPGCTRQLALLAAVLAFTLAVTTAIRRKRQAYDLPDGSQLLLYRPLSTSFRCQSDGYYADVDNSCQIFHVCHQVSNRDGSNEMQQFTFLCGNQTVFNQMTLTCAFPEDAVPCHSSAAFFYLNGYLGVQDAPLLSDDDVQRGDDYKAGK